MIARIHHPERPDVQVFIPLGYDAQTHAWHSLVEPGTFCYQRMDAARRCLEHTLRNWGILEEESRLMRALCEHPQFEFFNDGIDDRMVSNRARSVVNQIERLSNELSTLLDEPGENDIVMIDGDQLHVDDVTGTLPDLDWTEYAIRSDIGALDLGSADELFAGLVAQVLKLAGTMSGAPVTRRGITMALTWLVVQGIAEVDAAINVAAEPGESPANDLETAQTAERNPVPDVAVRADITPGDTL